MTWAPLCADQPVEGEPSAVRTYGAGLERTANRIARQAEALRGLADPQDWQSECADAFREQALDLAEEIEQAEQRYRRIGGLVQDWAQTMDEARGAAEQLRDEALRQQRIVDANPPAGPEAPPADAPPGTLPAMTPEGNAQNDRRAAAERRIEDLRDDLDRLLGRHQDAGDQTGQQIRAALDDGLGDRWQDRLKAWVARHADTLKTIATWAGRIAAVVGVVALFLTPFGWVALAAALVAVVASGLLAMSGDGSWVDFGLNVVGAATFGIGAFLTRGVSTAFRAGRGLLATRAATSSRAAVLNAPDGVAVSLVGRLPLLGDAVRGMASVSRAVRAPVAGTYRYLATRFAPLPSPTVLQTVAYGGRRTAAIRLEAIAWTRSAADDVARLGETVLRSGWVSGTRFVPAVALPGSASTLVASARDLDSVLDGIRSR